MAFAIIENNTFIRWRSPDDFPNTSFPQWVDHPTFNVFWVHPVSPANPDPSTYKTVHSAPVYSADNSRWETSYTYPEMTQRERNDYKDAKADRSGFRNAFLEDPLFLQWQIAILETGTKTDDIYLRNLMSASTVSDTDVSKWIANIQSIYDLLKTDVPPPVGAIAAWQKIADNHSIRFVA